MSDSGGNYSMAQNNSKEARGFGRHDENYGLTDIPVGRANVPREVRMHETLDKSCHAVTARLELLIEALARRVEPVSRQVNEAGPDKVAAGVDAISSTSPLAQVVNDFHRRLYNRLNDLETIINRIEL